MRLLFKADVSSESGADFSTLSLTHILNIGLFSATCKLTKLFSWLSKSQFSLILPRPLLFQFDGLN